MASDYQARSSSYWGKLLKWGQSQLRPNRLAASAGLALAVVLSTSAPVAAQQAAKTVTVRLTQAKVVKDAKGAEQFVDAVAVKPGDIIQYKAIYTNASAKPVTKLLANVPIPEGLEYIPSTAQPGAVQTAAKDNVFSDRPLTHVVAGKIVPLPYNQYRAVRWTIGRLAAGGSVTVAVRARVDKTLPRQVKVADTRQP